jgi:hypothetical protein
VESKLDNGSNPRSLPGFLLVAAAVASGALYLTLALTPDLSRRPLLYLLAHGALVLLALGALAAARHMVTWRRAITAAVLAAALFRLLLLAGPPLLSPDLFRYLWDGQVSGLGWNPYARAPADPVFDEAPLSWREEINHPELPTIYPPVAQAAFRGMAALGGGPHGWKALAAAADLLVLLLLVRWPGPRSRRLGAAFLYGWNPLVVVETAGSGHVDILGVALLVLAARWIMAGRGGESALAWTGSLLVKPLALAALPAFFRRCGWLRSLLLAGTTTALLYWPYRRLGLGALGSLGTYARSWSFNSPVYETVHGALESSGSETLLKALIGWVRRPLGDPPWLRGLYEWVHPEATSRLLLALALAGLVALVWRRRPPLTRELLVLMAGAVLLAPTVHPWYLLWFLPWAALERSGPLLLLSALVPLSYLAAAAGESSGPLLLALQYGAPTLWAFAPGRRWWARDRASRARIRASGG